MNDQDRGDMYATIRDILKPGQIERMTPSMSPLEKLHYRANVDRPAPMDNPVPLSVEIILGIEQWMAIQVRELKDGDEVHEDGYGFDKFLMVLNRRCPGVLRAILDAGADIYV